jgi:hypothetical protein
MTSLTPDELGHIAVNGTEGVLAAIEEAEQMLNEAEANGSDTDRMNELRQTLL